MNDTLPYSSGIASAIALLSESYVSLIKSGTPFKAFPSVMLWGAPGVGKSQGVKQIAQNIEKQANKRVVVTDVRLLLFNPVDLRGIPTANADKTLAVWLKPQIFQMDEDEGTVNILFLDEISAAPPSVQAAAYQIVLDRRVGEHTLPDNCIVIAAGNRVTDKSVAYNMPKALANRFCHLEIGVDVDSWHDWAILNGIHEFVSGYLEYNPTALIRPDVTDSLAFPTPRSWEMVSNILNNVSENMSRISPMITGCIGQSSASNFKSWTELYPLLPSVEDIFNGKEVLFENKKELLIALRSSMVAYARKHPDKVLIDNSIDFACGLPWDFRVRLLHDYGIINELQEILWENEVYIASVKKDLK